MFGIIASVLSWQQWCYQQPKEVQYHCHPVKGFFHELTLDYFSLEDVLPTVIICDWCIGWGLKVDKSICLEVHFCRMLFFSKLFFFRVDGCIKIKSWQFLWWRILWQCNNGRAANRSVCRILKIQICFSEYFLQFIPDVSIVHFRFLSLAFQRCVYTIHFIPFIFGSNISLVGSLSHTCISTFKFLEDEFGFIVLFIKTVLFLPPVLYCIFQKGNTCCPPCMFFLIH